MEEMFIVRLVNVAIFHFTTEARRGYFTRLHSCERLRVTSFASVVKINLFPQNQYLCRNNTP